MIDGSGMTQPDASDPSTWTATSNAYQNEWQTRAFLSGATNSKIAWTVFDLGSSTPGLRDLYLWNVREDPLRGTGTYSLYYSDRLEMGNSYSGEGLCSTLARRLPELYRLPPYRALASFVAIFGSLTFGPKGFYALLY